jgi:hypothetical protein
MSIIIPSIAPVNPWPPAAAAGYGAEMHELLEIVIL